MKRNQSGPDDSGKPPVMLSLKSRFPELFQFHSKPRFLLSLPLSTLLFIQEHAQPAPLWCLVQAETREGNRRRTAPWQRIQPPLARGGGPHMALGSTLTLPRQSAPGNSPLVFFGGRGHYVGQVSHLWCFWGGRGH